MKFVVAGSKDALMELSNGQDQIDWLQAPNAEAFAQYAGADAFFNLYDDAWQAEYKMLTAPVFINSVAHPLSNSENVIRFNGWKGFMQHETWELAGFMQDSSEKVLEALNKKYLLTADEPGFISARIIAMIINEAWFALGDKISTEAEIDIAMKLGTNYPYGPFEWGYKIGMKNIYDLLQQMALQHKKYLPAPLLQQYIQAP
jgi:3-hydroxybutyryl-CoA dehydrogenase